MFKNQSSKKRNPWAWVPSLYFAEGVPYVAVMTISLIMYKRLGLSNTDITLYTSWLYLPWVIKPLWSPFVDMMKSLRRYDEVEALVDYHHAVAHWCRIGWCGLHHSWSVVVAGLSQLLLADGVQQCHARYCRRWLLYAGSRPARASLFCRHPLHLLSHSHYFLVRIAGGFGWCFAGADSQHQLFVESGILFHGRSFHRPVALSQLGIAQTR